ncbi:MAG TPA: helix-turn-helix transcriptional regulator [Polyangia bacterium]|nr:helix-turn-helix transcriptional regulator [Polyangia bacterium]
MAIEAHKNEASHSESTPKKAENDERGDHAKKEESLGSAHHAKSSAKKVKNNVRKLRMERMMSKAELARRAGLSTLTVDRVERGMSCRMDTKRKILEALGLKPQDRVMVFGDAEED